MNIVQIIIVTCWILLGSVWTVGAFFQKKSDDRSLDAKSFAYAFSMIIALALLVKQDISRTLYAVIINQSFTSDIISVILCILGLIIAIWARTALAGNWSVRVVLKKGHELVQKGPYRLVRHPIYTGLLLMYIGTAIMIGRVSGFIGLIILFIGLWIKLKQEESLMIKHFGKKYADYKKKTKALIPHLL